MLDEIMDVLANLGLVMRDTRKKSTAKRFHGLSWGAEKEGFALAIRAVTDDRIEIVLKRTGTTPVQASLPHWLLFYEVAVTQPDGTLAALSPYGQTVLEELRQQGVSVAFEPGEMKPTEIPIAAMFHLRMRGEHKVTVACPVPNSASGSKLHSNELRIVRS